MFGHRRESIGEWASHILHNNYTARRVFRDLRVSQLKRYDMLSLMESGLTNLPRSSEERQAILLQIVGPVLADLEHSEEILSKFLSSQYAYIQMLVRHIE